jgi:type II secretory pathway pseudopilin PulG
MNTIHSKSSGFTLVEAALSVAIIGILLVASTATFGSIARMRKVQIESRLAHEIGTQLMNEVMQCSFQQSGTGATWGPSAGQQRSTFTVVDDYDGYSASPPLAQSGTALSGYTGWTESVAVAYADPTTLTTGSTATTLKEITVKITAPSGKAYTLLGLRSKYGAYEVAPSVQTTYVTGVAVTLQGASPAKTVYTGAHPLNISTSQ